MQAKSLLVGLCLGVVACALGCIVVLSVGRGEEPPDAAPRWEYRVVTEVELFLAVYAKLESSGSPIDDKEAAARAFEKYFNSLGREGWQLVSFDDKGRTILSRRAEK